MPRAYFSHFFRRLSKIINQYSAVVARSYRNCVPICAERHTLKRSLSFDSLYDHLVVDVVEHHIFVQTDRAKQQLV